MGEAFENLKKQLSLFGACAVARTRKGRKSGFMIIDF